MPRRVCYAALLAALFSAPLSAGIVLLNWFRMDRMAAESISAAHWAGQLFVTAFDVLVLLMWLPCALWISWMNARLRVRS